MLLLIAAAVASTVATECNSEDRQVYLTRGREFPALFRSYGGVTVRQARYEQRIVDEMHLSAKCAHCYGEAYTCGRYNCWWPCRYAGESCDTCLAEHHCSDDCDRCTGFR